VKDNAELLGSDGKYRDGLVQVWDIFYGCLPYWEDKV
jgi:hypothetical protein